MNRIFSSCITFIVLLYPSLTHAYVVPEIEYWRAYVTAIINQSREKNGLDPVGIDKELNHLSQKHAEDMSQNFDISTIEKQAKTFLGHNSSDGRTFSNRVHQSGIQGAYTYAENVGYMYMSHFTPLHTMIGSALTFIHEGMMAELPPEDSHKKTILGDYTHVGVGIELHKNTNRIINAIFLVTDYAKKHSSFALSVPTLDPMPHFDTSFIASKKEVEEARDLIQKKPVRFQINFPEAEQEETTVSRVQSKRIARTRRPSVRRSVQTERERRLERIKERRTLRLQKRQDRIEEMWKRIEKRRNRRMRMRSG